MGALIFSVLKYFCLFSSFLLVAFVSSQSTMPSMGKFACDDSVSVNCNPVNCSYGITVKDYDSPCAKCQRCIRYLDEDESCSKHDITTECGPGLNCTKVNNKYFCKPLNTTCMQAQKAYDESYENGTAGMFEIRPDCDQYGIYKGKQCQPGSTCYCVDEDNNRIFGEAVPNNVNSTKSMDCQCSRQYEKMRKLGYDLKSFPHCLPNGNFDRLQCYRQACQCLNEKLEPSGDLFPITAVTEKPCYNPEVHTPKYLRPCEEELKSYDKEDSFYLQRNTTIIRLELPQCTPDGNYHPVQKNKTMKFCVSPAGLLIENFAVALDSFAAKQMNCTCARTRYHLANQNAVKPQCCFNGNYKPLQCRNGYCFCVNESGEQTTKEVPVSEASTLSCKQDCHELYPETLN